MCVHPLRIRNKAFDPSNPHSCEFVDVPCGHCPECVDHINNEYAFRAFMHTDYTVNHGGSAYFVTLTYNDQFIPILRYRTKSGVVRQCSTWNKHHLRSFIHNLRSLLFPYKLSYMFVTERGSAISYKDSHGFIRVGTRRPHYHGLLWISGLDETEHQSDSNEQKLYPKNIEELITQNWIYGRVDFQTLSRSPQTATKYITKYMGKQGCDITQLIPINQIVSHNCQDSKFEGLIFSDSQFKPFKLISKNVGSSFIPSKEQLEGTQKVSFDGREFTLPRYYQKRYFKTLDKSYARPSDIVTTRSRWTKDVITPTVSYRQVYVPKIGYCVDGNPDLPISPSNLRYSSKTIETPDAHLYLDFRFSSRLHRLSTSLLSFSIAHVDICGVFRLYLYLKNTKSFDEYFKKHIIDLSEIVISDSNVSFRGHDIVEFTNLITNSFDYDSFSHYLPPLLRERKGDRNLLDFYDLFQLFNRCNQSIQALKNNLRYKAKFSEMLFKKPELFKTLTDYEQLFELDS